MAKVLRYFVFVPEFSLRASESASLHFPKMIQLAEIAELPIDDIEHMRDFFGLILLARSYYFLRGMDDACARRIQ